MRSVASAEAARFSPRRCRMTRVRTLRTARAFQRSSWDTPLLTVMAGPSTTLLGATQNCLRQWSPRRSRARAFRSRPVLRRQPLTGRVELGEDGLGCAPELAQLLLRQRVYDQSSDGFDVGGRGRDQLRVAGFGECGQRDAAIGRCRVAGDPALALQGGDGM